MDEQLLEFLKEKNNIRAQELLGHLGAGGAKDYAEYREVVGTIRGLQFANNVLDDLLERSREANDD